MTESDNVIQVERWVRAGEAVQKLTPPLDVPTRLHGGGGGDNSGGMEQRIERLEKQVDRIGDRVQLLTEKTSETREQLATLTERVSHLPSKGYIDTRLLGMLAIIAALITFGDKLKALLH